MEDDLDLQRLGVDLGQVEALKRQLAQAQVQRKNVEGRRPTEATFMGMTMGGLFAGLVVSTLGLAFIRYGKTTGKILFALFGAVMFATPFFVTSTWPLIVAGAALFAAPVVIGRFVRF